MDTYRWVIGAVMIAIGLPLYFLARYLEASEDTKKRRVRDLKLIAIIWMAVGVIIYLVALIMR
jgi:heme/copper-type cytochrome/quinol oxidase subunit 2